MTCDEFENLLQEVLDRRETPSADPFLIPHAKTCTACQRKVSLYEALFDGLELAETPALGSDFSSQISRAATVRRKWNWKRPAGILAALAASLLLVIVFANRDRDNDQPAGPSTLAENDSGTTPAEADRQDRRERRNREHKSPGPMVGLGHHGNQQATPETELAAGDIEQIIQEFRTASENISLAETGAATARLPGVRPLTSSLGSAFDAIRQTLPGGRGDGAAPSKPQARMMSGDAGRQV